MKIQHLLLAFSLLALALGASIVVLAYAPGERSALVSRMLEAGFATEDFSKVNETKNRSNELIRIEKVTLNAVRARP